MLEILKSFSWIIRAFSETPYAIIINESRTIKRVRIIHSIIASVIVLSLDGIFMYTRFVNYNSTHLTSDLFSVLRSSLDCASFIIDINIQLDRNKQFSLALKHIHTYDVCSKFPKNIYHPKLKFCRIVIIIIFIYRISITYVTYQATFSYFLTFLYFMYLEFSLKILHFCGLLLGIYQRFHHLNQLISKQGQSSNGIRLENIWCFHWNLTIATELINEIWSTQLLIWIGTLFLNMLSRTYNVLIKLEQVESSVRDTMGIVGCFFCLYIIIYFCHLTSSQANKSVDKLFSPVMRFEKNGNDILQDIHFASSYFCTKKIEFTAGKGFIRIHLPLLISMGGAMTTYLVILYKSPSKQ